MAMAGALISAFLTSCGDGDGPRSYSVGGSVSGLVGSDLVLANSNGDSVTISANGSFKFQMRLAVGTAYHVSVSSEPDTNPKQRCTVSNGNGTSIGAAITDVSVNCVGPFVYLPAQNVDYNNGDEGYPVIYAYTMDVDTGALIAVSGSPFATGAGGSALNVDGTGHFAYLAVSGSSVYGYAIDQGTGALEPLAGSPYQFGSGSMQLDRTGRFAYAGLIGLTPPESSIAVAAIDLSTGALVPIAGSPVAAEPGGPNGFSFSSDGRFLYTTSNAATVNGSNRSAEIYGFGIDPSTGSLTPLPGGALATGNFTSGVILDPKGRFAYVEAYDVTGEIWAYAIDAATGALSPVPGSPFTVGGQDPSIDPEGRFLMTVQTVYPSDPPTSQGGLWVYEIDAMTGALTQVGGSPFPTTGNPSSQPYFDAAGNFAYSIDLLGGPIIGYAISPSTGVLTPLAGSPFPTPGQGVERTMTFDPSGRFIYVQGGEYKGPAGILSVSALDPITGALTTVSSSDDLSSAVPASLTIVPLD
jgi:6-phosphogluconolactonase (cycloisomerase 2 family)